MNRRGFISLMAGGAGAVLVPWRGRIEPVIVLPPRVPRGCVRVSGLEIINLGIPREWIQRPIDINRDCAWIDAARLAQARARHIIEVSHTLRPGDSFYVDIGNGMRVRIEAPDL